MDSVPAQLLPEGFALPPLPYLVVLVVGALGVGAVLYRRRPPVTARHVLATTPWIVAGAAAHVSFVTGWAPEVVRPLLGTPAVYVSVGILAGAVWLVSLDRADVPRTLASVGVVPASVAVAVVVANGVATGGFAPAIPVLGLVAGGSLGLIVARVVRSVSDDVAVAGRAATLAVVAHGIDGVTTAVGVDLLGFGERTPLSRAVIEFAASLPVADVIGAGWLFVLVKLVVAGVAVAAIAPAARETPREGYGLLTVVAAVGLGPGVHNALLFAVA